MSENTKIEWADHTFNPWTGCTKVSPGCDHCYAEGWAKRSGQVQWGPGAERRRTSAANWKLPLRWDTQAHAAFVAWERFRATCLGATDADLQAEGFIKPRRPRVFCASLADVFDNEVPIEWRADLFRLIESTPHLDWLLLTKRIGNAAEMMFRARGGHLPILPNVWIGASITTQTEADRDIPKLLATPAAKRFLSMEPLLRPVDLRALRVGDRLILDALTGCHSSSAGPGTVEECLASLPRLPGILPPVDWVIGGGESGPKARPMHPDWARSLRDQCTAAGVAFHFKQWGEWVPAQIGPDVGSRELRLPEQWVHRDAPGASRGSYAGFELMRRLGKKAAGRLLDGRTWDEVPG